jgi:hypothetical protein
MPLQHDVVAEQAWPYWAHTGASTLASVPPSLPPVPPVPPELPPQVPASAPGGTTQRRPVQQSAFVVQRLPDETQVEPQCRAPVASGTHGAELQQSPENEHEPPAGTHCPRPLQRGIPTASGTQHSFPEMQPQQSARTFVVPPWHTIVFVKWQTLPSGSQENLQVCTPDGQLDAIGVPQVPIWG